ncbi:MAG: class I SAM-dependent methyltransferase [Candidatus Bathyarchaeia archaeon]
MSCAPYVSSSLEIVRQMLEIAEVGPKDLVYDLGCGDGRILIAAVKDFKAKKAVGYEIRDDIYEIALAEIVKQNLQDRIKLIKGDFFKANISRATVITLYLTTGANEALRPKLEKEARHGARVVSHNYEIPGWQPTCVKKFMGHTIYLYKIPTAWSKERTSV